MSPACHSLVRNPQKEQGKKESREAKLRKLETINPVPVQKTWEEEDRGPWTKPVLLAWLSNPRLESIINFDTSCFRDTGGKSWVQRRVDFIECEYPIVKTAGERAGTGWGGGCFQVFLFPVFRMHMRRPG